MSREAVTHDIYHSDGSVGSLYVQRIFLSFLYALEKRGKPEIQCFHLCSKVDFPSQFAAKQKNTALHYLKI